MKTVINPDLPVLQADWWFEKLSLIYRKNAGQIARLHVRTSKDGEMRICAGYFAHASLGQEQRILINNLLDVMEEIHVLLRLPTTIETSIQMTGAGFWHWMDGEDELVHTPFNGMSGHEVLEAHAAAQADPAFGCSGFAPFDGDD